MSGNWAGTEGEGVISALALLGLCVREGIIERDAGEEIVDKDLMDSGLIDSMGLLSLQSLIEEHFQCLIPQELFVMELRSFSSIAKHLQSEAARASSLNPKNGQT